MYSGLGAVRFFPVPVPDSALFNPGALGGIAMFRVTGVFGQKVTGNVRALAAVKEPFFLAAGSQRAFTVEGMAVCSHAASAAAAFFICAFGAVQSAS